MDSNGRVGPFFVMDCALASLAVGLRAQSLRELKTQIREVHPDSLYHHFWGTLLRPRFSDREYNNDFASWARHGLHDDRLAERLAVIDPTDYPDLEALRDELVDVMDERLDESETVPSARVDQMFYFLRSIVVVFDTHLRIEHPRELGGLWQGMSTGASSITSSMRADGTRTAWTISEPGSVGATSSRICG